MNAYKFRYRTISGHLNPIATSVNFKTFGELGNRWVKDITYHCRVFDKIPPSSDHLAHLSRLPLIDVNIETTIDGKTLIGSSVT
ncbi:MAG: hypothetical protein ACFFFG_13730 [Candidatus Thorarchaeota archaeon]